MNVTWTTCPMCGATADSDAKTCASCGEPRVSNEHGPARTYAAGASTRFANRLLLLTLALYVPYFVLPVANYLGDIYGYEAILLIFIFPPLWPIAALHVGLWWAMIAVKKQRWRLAMWCGSAALTFRLLVLNPEASTTIRPPLGWCTMVASIAVLLCGAVIGGRRFGPPELQRERKWIAVMMAGVVVIGLVYHLLCGVKVVHRPSVDKPMPVIKTEEVMKKVDRDHPGIRQREATRKERHEPKSIDKSRPEN